MTRGTIGLVQRDQVVQHRPGYASKLTSKFWVHFQNPHEKMKNPTSAPKMHIKILGLQTTPHPKPKKKLPVWVWLPQAKILGRSLPRRFGFSKKRGKILLMYSY